MGTALKASLKAAARSKMESMTAEIERLTRERDEMRAALEQALLWTDAEHDVGHWREAANALLAPPTDGAER